jgi:hypothetical protein
LAAADRRIVVGTGFAGGRAGGGLVGFVTGGGWGAVGGGVGAGTAAVVVLVLAAVVVVVGTSAVVDVVVGVGPTAAAIGSPEELCGTTISDTPVAASTTATPNTTVRRRVSCTWWGNTPCRATGPPGPLRPIYGSQDELRLS